MKRLRHKFNMALLTICSLLCGIAVILWPLSHLFSYEKELTTDDRGGSFTVWLGNGRVGVAVWSVNDAVEPIEAIKSRILGRERFDLRLPNNGDICVSDGIFMVDQERARAADNYHVAIPLWYFIILFGTFPAVWSYKRIKVRRRDGMRCSNCGYDLRATPDRCPECGKTAKSADLVNISQPKT